MCDDVETKPCQECEVSYYVVWNNDGFSVPEYCPFCGCETPKEEL